MTKNTFLIPWAAAFLLLLVAGLFSNNGPALAQEPSNQPINLLPDPLTATLKDNLENEALAAEVGDQLTYVTELSVNPIPIGNQKIEPVYEIVYQLDADETVTVSSVYDTTPIAYDDTYFLPSATDFQILASDGLLASGSLNSSFKETLAADQDFDQTQAVSVLAETVTTDFAKITIGVDGSFTYSLFDSTLGVPSADYFSYTISDDEGNQDTGSVILQFNHQRIFFVDSEAETAGNGLLESPFQQLDAALAAADSTCDVIFLLSSATPYDIDHVELLDCQKLIGQDYAPYSFAQISGLDVGAVPVASANNRPIIRCAQSVDYLTGIDPTEMFPTTSQGCIELAQDNVVAGITVDNPDPIQKAIAGENFSTFLGFNITALNSDGFSFSCNDSAAHEVKLTDSIRVQSYGFIGIDLAAFPTSPLTQEQCVLEGDLANVSVVDAAAAAHEAVYAISQSAAYLSLKIDQFEASNIAKSVIRATANDSSTLSLEVTNAQMSDFDMVGVAVENYVFWPLAGRERGLFASVTDSVMVPNTNGRGILANSQGNVASDLKFSNNEIGQVGVRSDGIVVYGNNNGAVNAIINDNLLLSRGAPNPNLPTNQTHAPHMPLYFESNMPDAVGCLAIAGNQAPAGFNYAYGLETASLGLKAGNNGELRIEGWNGQNGQSGVSQLIQENNVELLGGTEIILSPGGEISGGLCDPISIPVKPVLNTAADLSQLTVDVAGPEVIIPVLPPGKTVTIQMTAVVNELAEGLDRVSAQGAYTVDGLNQSHLTLDPNPPAGFEDANGRTVTPLLLISEPVPDLLVSDVVVAEDVDQATITVQLSEAASQDIQIDYATVAGTALAGSDYEETNGQITFPAGSVSQSFQVVIIDDVVTEADEQFAVSFSAVAGMPVTIPDSTSQIAILANDAVIVVPTLIVTDATVSEDAGSISIELTLSEPSATAVGIAYLSANGSAVAGSDFAAVSGEVVFAPGETAATIVISIIDDAVSEADEQFSVNVSATAGSSVLIPDSTIAVTIQDNDDAPVPNLSAADLTVNEGSGVATVQINLDVASAQNLEINYQTFAEVAISPDDYTAVTGVLTIPAGTQTASFDIPIVDDVDAELNEYFFVRLTTADASVLKIKNPELVVTIVDNDEILLFAGNSNGQAVRVVEDEGIAFVDISLNRPATAEVQVDVSTQNLLAMSPSDYTAVPPTTLIFAPGEVRKTVEIAIIDDAASFEGLERFRLKVENLVNATLHGQAFAEVVIIDNDNPAPFIYFEFADYSIYEDMDNNPATASELDVVVKLSNPSASTITVTVKSIDNASSATTPEDYTAINQIVTIPAGQREAVVTVSVNEDDIPERQETFALRFFDTSSGVIVDPTQNSTTVTIADGTPPVMRLNHTFITTSFTENNQMAVELVLSGNVVLPVRFGVQSFQEAGIKRHLSVSGFGSALRVFKLEPGTARFRLSFSTPTTHGQDAGSTFSNDPFDLAEIIIVDGAHGLYSPNRVEPSVRPYTFFMPIMFGK